MVLVGRHVALLHPALQQFSEAISVEQGEDPLTFEGLTYLQGLTESALAVMAQEPAEAPVLWHPGTAIDDPKGTAYEVTPGDGSVRAMAAGQVFFVGERSGYGTTVVIRHADGYRSYYWQMQPQVKVGDAVQAGTAIGQCEAAYRVQLWLGQTVVTAAHRS